MERLVEFMQRVNTLNVQQRDFLLRALIFNKWSYRDDDPNSDLTRLLVIAESVKEQPQ